VQLVKTIDNETLGGARAHNELSGVAHYRIKNDEEAIAKIREFITELPNQRSGVRDQRSEKRNPKVAADKIYEIVPEDHRQPYDTRALLDCILDDGDLDEFQATMRKRSLPATRASGEFRLV
jgi:acetyl-CoA carboxylase carboxyltransferase component